MTLTITFGIYKEFCAAFEQITSFWLAEDQRQNYILSICRSEDGASGFETLTDILYLSIPPTLSDEQELREIKNYRYLQIIFE